MKRWVFIGGWALAQAAVLVLAPVLGGRGIAAEALAGFLLAAVHAITALGVGLLLLRLLKCPISSEFGEGGAACFLGVGLLGLATLLLGLAGLTTVPVLRGLMFVLAVALSPLTGPRLARFVRGAHLPAAEIPAALVASLLIALLALHAAMPPLAFDALEYHLAVPQIWLRAGEVFPVPGNFFSHQPFAIEMNFLIGLALGGDEVVPAKWFTLAGLVSVFGLTLAMGRTLGLWRGVRIAAALLVASTPLIYKTCTDALVDIWVVAGVLTATQLWQRWLISRKPGALLVAALALGLLMSVKQTATAVWVIPLLCLYLWTMMSHRLCPPEWIISIAVVAMLAALAMLPWWVKEWAWSGNPLFPLAFPLFGGEGWSAAQNELLVGGHGLRSPLSAEFWRDAWQRLHTASPLPLSLIAGSALFAWRRQVRGLVGSTLGMTAGAFLIWNLLQHSADRFIAPAAALLAPLGLGGLQAVFAWTRRRLGASRANLAVLVMLVPFAEMMLALRGFELLLLIASLAAAVLALMGSSRARRHVSGWAALLPAAVLAAAIAVSEIQSADPPGKRLAHLLGRQPATAAVLGLPHLDAFRFFNEIERPGGKVLLVYESRTFDLDAPAVMGTVFDGQALREFVRGAATLDEVLARLRAAGISHALINLYEMERISATYFGGAGAGLAYRPLWDFPSPLTDEEYGLVREFHLWVINNSVYNWRGLGTIFVARL